MTEWFRGFIQGKTRIAIAWIFAVLLLFAARKQPTDPGILLCFIGATVRFWASGYLRKDSKIAVGGPYAFVRNPLYLGTYLMAVGVALAIGSWPLIFTISVLYALIYHYIILDEEIKLSRLFGEPYNRYRALVPRFFPRIFPPMMPASRRDLMEVNANAEHHDFSWEIAMKNKAYEAYLSFIGLILCVILAAHFWSIYSS